MAVAMLAQRQFLIFSVLLVRFAVCKKEPNEVEKLYLTNNSEGISEVLTREDFERAEALAELAENPELAEDWEEQGEFEGDISGINASHIESYVEESNRFGGSSFVISGSAALRNRHLLWYNATIPYTISSQYSSLARTQIALAFKVFHETTCIRFVPREEDDKDYIAIKPENGCFSTIGKSFLGGAQTVGLAPGCIASRGIVLHELMHAIGFFHEQSRPDRDNFIEIVRENIRDGKEIQFKTYDLNLLTDLGEPYDTGSIMHYGKYAFSKNGQQTIQPKEEGVEIGQRRGLSDLDLVKVNKLYECFQRSCNFSALEYKIEIGIEGQDIERVRADSEDSCCGQCFQHPHCHAFVYDLNTDTCILKSAQEPLIPSPDQLTGLITRPNKSSVELTPTTTTEKTRSICEMETTCAEEAICTEDSSHPDGYNCRCPRGFSDMGGTALPGRLCIPEVNECADSSLNDCDPAADCFDLSVGFRCSCPSGYMDVSIPSSHPGKSCIPLITPPVPTENIEVNECADLSLNDCDPAAECTDLSVGFRCSCPSGYMDVSIPDSHLGRTCLPLITPPISNGTIDDCEGLAEGEVKEYAGYWAKCLNGQLTSMGCMSQGKRVRDGDFAMSADSRFFEVCWHQEGGFIPVECVYNGDTFVRPWDVIPTSDGFLGMCVLINREGIRITNCLDSEGNLRSDGETYNYKFSDGDVQVKKTSRCHIKKRDKVLESCNWTFSDPKNPLQQETLSLKAGCYALRKEFLFRCQNSDLDSGVTRLPPHSYSRIHKLAVQKDFELAMLDDEGLRTGTECLLPSMGGNDFSVGYPVEQIHYHKSAIQEFLLSLIKNETKGPHGGPSIYEKPETLHRPGVLWRENRDIVQEGEPFFVPIVSISLSRCYEYCDEEDKCRGISFLNGTCLLKYRIDRTVYKAGSVIAIKPDAGVLDESVCEEAKRHGICSFHADCVVVEGRAVCICPFSYQDVSIDKTRQDTGRRCIKVDTACRSGSDDCGPNSICMDYERSYTCSCVSTFAPADPALDGRNCIIPVY